MYQFALIDPRDTSQAAAHNNEIFLDGRPAVLGIEVTVPRLAEMCNLGNLDHHGDAFSDQQCAIEMAMEWIPLPKDGVILVTVRPDPDSVGAMAILELRRRVVETILSDIQDGIHERLLSLGGREDPTGHAGKAIRERVAKIAQADKAVRGPWPGPQPLAVCCWNGLSAEAIILTAFNGDEAPEMAALGAMCIDHKASLDDRVAMMITWLTHGAIPDTYISLAAAERRELVQAIESGKIKATDFGGVALVHSTHRAAIEVGYRLAPVVLTVNEAFRFQGGEPHLKYTICQYREGHVDLRAVLAELQAREPGWSGTATIIESPQGVSSLLSVEDVLEILEISLRNFRKLPPGAILDPTHSLAEGLVGCWLGNKAAGGLVQDLSPHKNPDILTTPEISSHFAPENDEDASSTRCREG